MSKFLSGKLIQIGLSGPCRPYLAEPMPFCHAREILSPKAYLAEGQDVVERQARELQQTTSEDDGIVVFAHLTPAHVKKLEPDNRTASVSGSGQLPITNGGFRFLALEKLLTEARHAGCSDDIELRAVRVVVPIGDNRDDEYRLDPTSVKLEARLLALGGNRVLAHPDRHVKLLLQRGRVYSIEGLQQARGASNDSAKNTALHYLQLQNVGHANLETAENLEIIRGYYLDVKGVWSQHFWLWNGTQVFESTFNAQQYFGVPLDTADAYDFVLAQARALMPCYDQLFEKYAAA